MWTDVSRQQKQHIMPNLHSPDVHKKQALTHQTCRMITCKRGPGTSTTCRPACLPTFIRGWLGLSVADMKHASVMVTHCPALDPSGWSGAGDHTTLPLFFTRHEIVAAMTGCNSLGWSMLLSGSHNLHQSIRPTLHLYEICWQLVRRERSLRY